MPRTRVSQATAAAPAAGPPVTSLKGVGPRLAERLARLGIHAVPDLLFHLPLRYQDRTRIRPIGSLRPGDQVAVEGTVQLSEVKFGKRRMLLTRISDGTGALTLRFFRFSASQQAALARGTRLRCFGEVRRGAATLEMAHPEYERIDAEQAEPVEACLTPVYPTTEGVHQLTLRKLTAQALAWLQSPGTAPLPDWLPAAVHRQPGFPDLPSALTYVHRPPADAPLDLLAAMAHPAQQRLAFEELVAHHVSLRRLRHSLAGYAAPALSGPGRLAQRFRDQLPFALTAAQERVYAEIAIDLARPAPMQRLVQGDVGSGKTVVAALAALQAIEAGFQAAVMAPTELLAEQHHANFTDWLATLGVPVTWLAGKLKGSERRAALAAMAEGEARLVVGTHALFQDEVVFADLGLVIIDEQHRFGVHQRLALREKGVRAGRRPHQLIMTATPIPRTLAMTAYADLDVSIIDELPPGRTPVETVVVPDTRRAAVVQRIRQACGAGRQAYWVCTLIEESEALQCEAAEQTAALLAEALPELRVGLVHGRMKSADKVQIMAAFKRGELNLLVATTVIEVGVDVPNASLMVIENAERLGLAQLHQLRGRVGRGAQASACVLMYHGPLSCLAQARLAIMRETNDGFAIANRDLELRGPGEVLGTRQTGLLQLRVADLQRDRALLPEVARTAAALLHDNPQAVEPLIARWLGERTAYGEV